MPNGAVPSSNSSINVPGPELIAQADSDARAIDGAHVGEAPRLPIGLTEHVPDDRDLLDYAFADAVRHKIVRMAT